MTGLSEAASWSRSERGVFVGSLTEDWAQGRSGFGGLVAAAAARAMSDHVEAERSLRSLQVTFIGPVSVGEVRVESRPLRVGRSLTYVHGTVTQGERVCATLVASFGATRATEVALEGPGLPDVEAPEGLSPMPYLEGLMPAFTRHFDYRWTVSTYPFSGGDEAHVQGWLRSRDANIIDDFTLIALLDAWAPPIWSLAKRPAPGSSVTWLVNLLRPLPTEGVSPDRWWLYDARSEISAGGYADVDGKLWGEDGRLIATSRQLFAEFSGS